MSVKYWGGPAFPSHGTMGEVNHEGMSLRDWFAGMALTGLMATAHQMQMNEAVRGERSDIELIAVAAFAIADAMIEQGQQE